MFDNLISVMALWKGDVLTCALEAAFTLKILVM
jgi:hypothetical protein